MNLLVTGGAGFIGSAYVRLARRSRPSAVVNVDVLTYAGTWRTSRSSRATRITSSCGPTSGTGPRFRARCCRGRDRHGCELRGRDPRRPPLFAARAFVRHQRGGDADLLEAARAAGERAVPPDVDRRGLRDLGATGELQETTPLAPKNPYSATKAAPISSRWRSPHARAPLVVTRCSNNYGPCQFPEKLIPLCPATRSTASRAGLRRRQAMSATGPRRRPLRGVDPRSSGAASGEVYNIGGRERTAPTSTWCRPSSPCRREPSR